VDFSPMVTYGALCCIDLVIGYLTFDLISSEPLVIQFLEPSKAITTFFGNSEDFT
jgi:hypothetical protein